jgi:hypothetical protein
MPNPEWRHALSADPDAVIARRCVAVADPCCGDDWFTLPLLRHGDQQAGCPFKEVPMKTKHIFRIILTVLGATAAGSLAYAQTMQMPTGEGNKGCPMMSTMDDGGMARMMGRQYGGMGRRTASVP